MRRQKMANRKPKETHIFVVEFYGDAKAEMLEVTAHAMFDDPYKFLLIDDDGYVVFDITRERLIKAYRKDLINEQRKAVRPVMFPGGKGD